MPSSEDFQNNQVVDTSENIFTGYTTILVDDQDIDRFYEKQSVYVEDKSLHTNQYLMLVSNANEKKTALARYISPTMPLRQLSRSHKIWGIKARNKEQQFLMDALTAPRKGHRVPPGDHGRKDVSLVNAYSGQPPIFNGK